MLKIPLYDQMHKVMFYDVLQQLCDKVNLKNFSKERNRDQRVIGHAMTLLGLKNQDELDVIMSANDSNAFDFAETVLLMGKLNPKIKLMMELQKGALMVQKKYAIYVDSV